MEVKNGRSVYNHSLFWIYCLNIRIYIIPEAGDTNWAQSDFEQFQTVVNVWTFKTTLCSWVCLCQGPVYNWEFSELVSIEYYAH